MGKMLEDGIYVDGCPLVSLEMVGQMVHAVWLHESKVGDDYLLIITNQPGCMSIEGKEQRQQKC